MTKDKCDALVLSLVGKDYLDMWWNSNNRAFDGKKPIDCDINEVYHYLLDFFGK